MSSAVPVSSGLPPVEPATQPYCPSQIAQLPGFSVFRRRTVPAPSDCSLVRTECGRCCFQMRQSQASHPLGIVSIPRELFVALLRTDLSLLRLHSTDLVVV